eukprot:g18446.t1
MQLGKAITKVNSTQSRPQWEDFRSEMMEETQGAYELGRLKTIWGMKFEFALRTAVAAFLASIYAMQPEVHKAEWENATVFAPVLAVACVSGPSLGATLHHAWEMWQATVIGCLSSMIVNEVLRPVQPNALREALMLVGFLSTVFFLCSRPWALVQKRVSVGVMLCGTINMLETFRDNQLKMKSLLGPASWELILMPQTWTQLSLAVKFFDAQLLCLRRVQLTTSSEGQKHLDRDIFRARAEIMYQSGCSFEEKEHQPVHHLQHVNRMACYFAVNELISATAKAATEAAHSERPSDPCSCWRKCLKWFELPPRHRAKNALKKVISLGLLCIGAWIPEWRAKRPEFIWAFIAASFIFSDLEGSSISTGLGRVIGTLFGGMVGFIVLEVFHFITWPWKELEIAVAWPPCAVHDDLGMQRPSSQDSIYEATAPHLSVVSEAPDSAPHTQKQMEAVYSKGNQALEAAKQGLVAATFEPTLWHKPFPMADFQRLLHTEEKALRLLHVLYAGTRAASPDSLDPDDPEAGMETSGLDAALQLFAVQRADQKLREKLEHHFRRFREQEPNPNAASYSTNATMFCLLHLTGMMTELADRLRVASAAEQVVVHV